MKKGFKRITALLLAVCMLVPMIPSSVYVAAAVEPEMISKVINFVSDTYSVGFEGMGETVDRPLGDWNTFNSTPATLSVNGWQYNKAASTKPAGSTYGMVGHPGSGVIRERALSLHCNEVGDSVAIDINFEKTGWYDVDFVVETMTASELADDRNMVAKIEIDGVAVGTGIDFGAGEVLKDNKYSSVLVGKKIYIEDGVHTFRIERTNSVSGTWTYITKINFQEVYGPAADFEIDFVGATTSLENATIDNDGFALNNDESSFSTAELDNGLVVNTQDAGDQVTVDFFLWGEGKYDIVLDAVRDAGYASSARVYIDGMFLTDIDLSDTSAEAIVGIGALDIKGGAHTFTVRALSSGASTFKVNKLTLNPRTADITEVRPTSVKVSLPSTSLIAGDIVDVFASVVNSDGSLMSNVPVKASGDPESENFITLSSSNNSVIKIENGELKALASGSANLIATAYVNKSEIKEKVNLKVLSTSSTDSFELIVDDIPTFPVGQIKEVVIQGKVGDVIVDLSKATDWDITSSAEDVLTAEVLHKNNGTVLRFFAWDEGDASFNISAKYDGMASNIAFDTTVSSEADASKATVINFATTRIGSYLNANLDLDGWELAPETLADPVFDLKHRMGAHAFKAGNTVDFHLNWSIGDTYTLGNETVECTPVNDGQEVYLNIKVPKTGWYALSFTGKQAGNYGAYVSFHIDDNYIGEFDFADVNHPQDDYDTPDNNIEVVESRMRDMYLTEGVHKFKIKRCRDAYKISTRNAYTYLMSLKMTPISQPKEIIGLAVNCDADSLQLGDSAKADFALRLSDGTDYHFPVNVKNQGGIELSEATPDRLSLANGVVTALSYGTGVIKVTGKRPGFDDYVANWTIPIRRGQMYNFAAAPEGKADAVSYAEENWTLDTSTASTTSATKTSAKVSKEDGLEARLRSNGHKMGLKINVLKAGAYDIDLSVNKKQSAATTDVYLNDTFLGTIDFQSEAEEKDVLYKLNSVQLNAGENTLHFVRRNASGGNMIYVNRMVISLADSMPTFSSVSIASDTDEVVYQETLQTNVKVWMSNGREYHFGKLRDGSDDLNNFITLSSTDTSKITVDQTGLLTGIAQGSANLKVDVKLGGDDFSEEKEFKCVRVLNIKNANDIFVTRLESASTELTATLDGVETLLANATEISATPADSATVSASIRTENDKVYLDVEALRAGNTYVTVTATVDGVTGSYDVPVTVFAPGPVKETPSIDFCRVFSGSPDSFTLEADGWQVNPALTSPGVIGSPSYGLGGLGVTSNMPKMGDKFVFDVMVNYAGDYAVKLTGQQVGDFGAVTAIYMDDMYLGTYSFYHPTNDETVRDEEVALVLNSLSLTQGVHTFTLHRLDDGYNYYRHNSIYIRKIDFERLSAPLSFEKAEAKLDRAENRMVVGETAKITTGALMSDGTFRNFGAKLDGSADTQNIAPVVTNETEGIIKVENGVVTALSAGTGKVKVVATVDGVEKTNVLEIEVVGEEIGTVEATLTDSTIYVNKVVGIDVVAKTVSGTVIKLDDVVFSATSSDDAVATTDGLSVKGVGEGDAVITVSATFGGNTVSKEIPITVKADGVTELYVKAYPRLIRPTNLDGTPNTVGTEIKVESATFNGEPVDLTDATIVFSTSATDIIDLNTQTGKVLPKGPTGEALVTVNVTVGEFNLTGEINIVVTKGKVGGSYFTADKVANARENANRYKWARDEMQATIAKAEQYLGLEEVFWDRVTTQELPRNTAVGYHFDPKKQWCRDPRCNANLSSLYSNAIYAYNMDFVNKPFQIQCKACRKWFPSNDFESFYELGLDEHNNWSYQKALDANQALVDAGEDGYLVNIRHPEMNGYTHDGITEGDNWGVDDGWGYKTGRLATDGVTDEVYTWVAMYNRFLFSEDWFYGEAVKHLSRAYMFTGDKEYARPAAIALDRLADVYPDMHVENQHMMSHSQTTKGLGRIEGSIWEMGKVSRWAHAYDLVWDIYDDPYVVNFLKEKAEKYKFDNDKSTPEKIRENFETNVLRETFEALKESDMYGNFGLHQILNCDAAIVLDDYENGTKDMLDYLMRYDDFWLQAGANQRTGGEILHRIYNEVNRDGGTNEGVSPNYTGLWYNTIIPIANALNGYAGYPAMDLYKLPKIAKMLKNQFNFIMTRKTSLPSADSGVTSSHEIMAPAVDSLISCYRATGDEEFLKMAYFRNGNKVDNIKESLYVKDPEAIQQVITKVINEQGELNLDDSRLLAGTGFALLRGGSWYGRGTSTENDNQRDFWMVGGVTGEHGHWDNLGIGMDSFGMAILPDLGYPDQKPEHFRRMWGVGSISHNLVVVDQTQQSMQAHAATPIHFDDAGRVKVAEMENPGVYSVTDEYRRTIVMVDADDDVSYGVDFFRVKGGSEHVYSFHALSQDITDYSGFNPFPRDGTYEGENVPYGSESTDSGYTYLDNIRIDDNVKTGEIMVNFKITDYHKLINDASGVNVKINMLNDFDLTDVAFAHGDVPDKPNNPKYVEYLLARRKGENLDSTFTSVIQPYNGEEYIEKTERVSIVRKDGKPVTTGGNVAHAIKVTLKNGRVDYIAYSSDYRVEYEIIDGNTKFDFCGAIGVCQMKDGVVAYNYVNHGTKMARVNATKAEYTGKVINFSKDYTKFEQWIDIKLDSDVDTKKMKDNFIYIENDGAQNAVYPIEDVTLNGDGTARIHIGNMALTRFVDTTKTPYQVTWNIANNQYFYIPITNTIDEAPVFEAVSNGSAFVDGRFETDIIATSPAGRPITYKAPDNLPASATFDEETGKLIWAPTSYDLGVNHLAFTATDGILESTVHFNVTVYRAFTPGGSGDGGNGGGGGGGGGGSSSDDKEDPKPEDPTPEDPKPGADEGKKFIDLGSHNWAEEAIYALVEAGIVNGTSANTYSPAKNMTRADYAIMLTRAFGIEGLEGANFADVDENAYYAEELRLAKAAGIVGGIGDNKFNPTGEITRQDMMVMLVRAMEKTGMELKEAEVSVLAQFTDAADISDYAQEAVAKLVANGIIAGSDGKINPTKKTTRAEVAVMLARIFTK